MPVFRQTGFAVGEIAPELHGRVDLTAYLNALDTARNVLVRVGGSVRRRPGTRFVAEVKDSTKKVRLIPFEFSTVQTYVLEFGELYMRVYMDGGQVLYPVDHPSAGQPVEIATPYTVSELPQLGYVQSADVMTLVHPAHPPMELTRTDHHLWTLTQITFQPAIAAPTGLTARKIGTGTGTTHSYVVTAESDDPVDESLPSSSASVDHAETLTATNRVELSWTAVTGAARYNVYKLRNGLYGYLGTTETTAFRDDGINPALDDTPPVARNPFAAPGDYPGAVAYFQQRLAFAGSDNRPETVYLSRTGSYPNFAVSNPLKDDDAITATLVGDQVNRIRHMVGLRDGLILFTTGAEWVLQRGDRGLTPSLEGGLRQESYLGSGDVRPLRVGNSVIFVQNGLNHVFDLAYDLATDGLRPTQLTLLASHLVEDGAIVDWAYAKRPDSVIWAVRDDGVLLALTYMPEQEVRAWSRCDTDGAVESIAAVREGAEDGVYIVVRRLIGGSYKRYIERLERWNGKDVRDAVFLDSALSWDDPKEITGVTLGSTTVVTVPGHGLAQYDLFELDELEGPAELNKKRYRALSIAGDDITLGSEYPGLTNGVEDPTKDPVDTSTSRPWVSGTGVLRKCVSTVSGLSHLEGREVSILADGSVAPPQTVSGGSVTVPVPSARIHVGLPFTSEIRTLALPLEPDLAARQKRIVQVDLLVRHAREIEAGPDETALNYYKPRLGENMGEPASPLMGTVTLAVRPQWGRTPRLLVRIAEPLPLEILDIMPRFGVAP